MNVTIFYDLPQEVIRKIYSYIRIKNNDERYKMLETILNNKFNNIEYTTQSGYYRKTIYFISYPRLILIKHFLPDMFIDYVFYNSKTHTSDAMRFYISEEFRLKYTSIQQNEKNANPFNRNDLQLFNTS